MIRTLVLSFVFAASATLHAGEITGRVVGVSDGDTIAVLDDAKASHKIRLHGIDAPEGHQAFGQRSKQALSGKIFDKAVRVVVRDKDKYGRTVGDVFLGDRYVNKEMVEDGFAWHYKKYSDSQALADAETDARSGKRGLWVDPIAVAPWEFRHPERQGVTQVPGDVATLAADETFYVTKTGTKYHRGGCRHLSKSRIPISLKDAKASYSACSNCKPPQ